MLLASVLLACFALLFFVEVFLGGALPRTPAAEAAPCPSCIGRMPVREFFGQALPLAAVGIGLPMSVQHPWGIGLVLGGIALHLSLRRLGKAC